MVSKFSEKEMRACTTGACTREENCNPTRCGVCVRTKQYNDHNAKVKHIGDRWMWLQLMWL